MTGADRAKLMALVDEYRHAVEEDAPPYPSQAIVDWVDDHAAWAAARGPADEQLVANAAILVRERLGGIAGRHHLSIPSVIVGTLGPIAGEIVAMVAKSILGGLGVAYDPVRVDAIATGNVEVKTVIVPPGTLGR